MLLKCCCAPTARWSSQFCLFWPGTHVLMSYFWRFWPSSMVHSQSWQFSGSAQHQHEGNKSEIFGWIPTWRWKSQFWQYWLGINVKRKCLTILAKHKWKFAMLTFFFGSAFGWRQFWLSKRFEPPPYNSLVTYMCDVKFKDLQTLPSTVFHTGNYKIDAPPPTKK